MRSIPQDSDLYLWHQKGEVSIFIFISGGRGQGSCGCAVMWFIEDISRWWKGKSYDVPWLALLAGWACVKWRQSNLGHFYGHYPLLTLRLGPSNPKVVGHK